MWIMVLIILASGSLIDARQSPVEYNSLNECTAALAPDRAKLADMLKQTPPPASMELQINCYPADTLFMEGMPKSEIGKQRVQPDPRGHS